MAAEGSRARAATHHEDRSGHVPRPPVPTTLWAVTSGRVIPTDKDLPVGGTVIGDPPWRPWTPEQIADRLAGVRVPWYVAGGWAVDLHLGRETPQTASREHEDLEIGVPATGWPEIAGALTGLSACAAGSGRLWNLADPAVDAELVLTVVHQTWMQDPADGAFVLDVFREPSDASSWVCRRDPTLRVPYAEVLARTATGIPYLRPEWVMLFKAKAPRPKDEADLALLLPTLEPAVRRRTRELVARVHPDHSWLALL